MTVEPIELTTSDGVILRGQHWVGGDHWALLFHEAGKDLDCWQPLATVLVERGYSLCALDLRGHGLSEGEWDVSALGADLEAAIDYASGFKASHIAFIGAGESALPALLDTHARRFFAIVGLSPGPLGTLSANDLRGRGVSKLFVLGSRDAQVEETVQRLRNRSIGWTVLLRLPTANQGTDLLSDPWRLQVAEHMIAFLEEQRYRSSRQANES